MLIKCCNAHDYQTGGVEISVTDHGTDSANHSCRVVFQIGHSEDERQLGNLA